MPPPGASTRNHSPPFRRRPPSASRRPWSGRSTTWNRSCSSPAARWNGSPPGSTPGAWGCKRLELSLKLEPEGLHELAIELPAPTREARTLLSLVRLHLEAEPPRAPITSMQLLAHPDVPRQAQLSLLGPAALSPDRPRRRHRPAARPARPEPRRVAAHPERPPAGTLSDWPTSTRPRRRG